MDVLQHITALRKERGWSEYRLAKESGISQSTLSNLYRRDNTPTVSTLEAFCKAFGISLAQFFTGINEDSILTTEQKGLLQNWVLLSSQQKEKVMAYIQGLLEG